MLEYIVLEHSAFVILLWQIAFSASLLSCNSCSSSQKGFDGDLMGLFVCVFQPNPTKTRAR
jgi:hypothetical protein